MKRPVVVCLAALTLAALGAGASFAVGETTGTNVACATATSPAHTVAVDATDVATIPGDIETNCVTTTYTIPTTTVTSTQTVTQTVTAQSAPTFGPWAWDATAATVATTSSTLAAPVIGASSSTLMSASVAEYDGSGQATSAVTIGSTTYQVPVGNALPGHSTDGHLVVTDTIRDQETDFWQYNASTKHAGGGDQFTLGAVSETRPGSADASRLPLVDGVITPSDVATMTLHPLVFSIASSKIASSPSSVYPADTSYGGTGAAGTPSFGAWFRLPPATSCATTMDRLSLYVCKSLVQYGMFLRDSGSGLTIYGLDSVNQGGTGAQAWTAAGVNLTQSSTAGLWYENLSTSIPWSTLQALNPPAP